MLIKDLLKEFTFDLKIKNYSKRTMETYNYNVNQLISFLEENHDVTLAQNNSYIYQRIFRSEKNYLEETLLYIQYFGVDDIFEFVSFCFEEYYLLPYIYQYIYYETKNENDESIRENLKTLIGLGVDANQLLDIADSFSKFLPERMKIVNGEQFKKNCF